MPSPRARELVEHLGLVPHPEGGHFREVFRSTALVSPADGRGPRAGLTVIHFLLEAGAHSRWHAVRSDEQWTFLEGAALELFVLTPEAGPLQRVRLGALDAGGTPTFVVPSGAWQAARPTGGHALVTCSVGPGFDFADFHMIADDPAARAVLARRAPELVGLL